MQEAWKKIFDGTTKRKAEEGAGRSVKRKLPDSAKELKNIEVKVPNIPGLSVEQDFITEREESELISLIYLQEWSKGPGKREVQQYAYNYSYKTKSTTPAYIGPIPEFLKYVTERVAKHFHREPDQIIINKYLPGQGIGAHIDHQAHFGPVVASLTLYSHCIMLLRRSVWEHPVLLKRRSLIVLSGKSRTEWFHEIPAVSSDTLEDGTMLERGVRISITFRTMNINEKVQQQQPKEEQKETIKAEL